MGFFEAVGAATTAFFLVGAGMITGHIVGNIYGGIKGAYRVTAIRKRYGHQSALTLADHRAIIRTGLRAWVGLRYRNGSGTYWQINGIIIPVDGRDKITRERFYGA